MSSALAPRYAIYFVPSPDSALWRFGSAVLGYDAASGADVEAIVPSGFDARSWHQATADPRQYGFHATLKAPFRLAEGRDEASLVVGLRRVAARLAPVDLGHCGIHVVPAASGGGFVAITPDAAPPGLAVLEREIITAFEAWRAPLTTEERARRRPEALTARQRDQLEHYGYPYVLDDFAFHMTLSGRLDAPHAVAADLQAMAQAVHAIGPITLDRLALFRQVAPDERFRLVDTAVLAR